MKICSKCKIERPYLDFCKDKSRKDGFRSQCKICRKQWHIDNPDYNRQYYQQNKTILTEKAKDYYELNKGVIVERNKKYQIKNATALKKQKKLYYEQNKTIINEKQNQYAKLNKIAIYEKRKEYYKKRYQLNKITISQKRKAYRQTEHGKLVSKADCHKRRAILKANTPMGKDWKPADIKIILKLQKNKCKYCNASIKDAHHIDHFTPAVKGGSNEAWNIQLLCKKCNLTKHAKLPTDYAQEHGKLF